MANYTLTIKQLVENKIKIFDFDYVLFDEKYKEKFEKDFIDYFYFDEIGFETVPKFKHRLKMHLSILLPHYNKLFISQNLEQRILDNYDVTEKYEQENSTDVKNVGTGENKNLYADTPQKKIDIENFDVVTNITKDNNKSENNTTGKSTNKWIRTMQGNIGIQTDADAIEKYENSLRNIELELFEKLSVLFMGVW